MNGVEINTRAYVATRLLLRWDYLYAVTLKTKVFGDYNHARLEVSWITSTRGLLLRGYTGSHAQCCSRRALVERSLCLKWLNMSFPTSSIPVILADEALQITFRFCVPNFFLEAPPVQPESEHHTAITLWFSMAKATAVSRTVSRRLARQCGSREKTTRPSNASGSNLQILLNKVGTLGRKSS